MKIVHISAECYPAAKAGGLGDVVGSLPKYLNRQDHNASVILPNYHNKWLNEAKKEKIFEGKAPFSSGSFSFSVLKLAEPDLGFDLFLIDIPGRFDRPGVYIDPWSGHAYWDEKERVFSFQIAALEWLSGQNILPDVVHCHDHHTALVPFMMAHCFRFETFREIPSVLTIHNGEYQGRYDMGSYTILPAFNLERLGLLDWDGTLNALAAGIKSAWKVTTVSEGYMQELLNFCHGLEYLLRHEEEKTTGILNGIDTSVWDPKTDPFLLDNYTAKNFKKGKKRNRKFLSEEFGLPTDKPLFSFIGRLVHEKGADLLPELIRHSIQENTGAVFLILGTGDLSLHSVFEELSGQHAGFFDSRLEYNEELAHRIYAGSDFLLMPSRVEPCGLNQLYSMRYGTIPVVRKTGGLADTVVDISEKDGYGLVFDNLDTDDMANSVKRGVELYTRKELFDKTRKRIMTLDFSWEKASINYISLYKLLKSKG